MAQEDSASFTFFNETDVSISERPFRDLFEELYRSVGSLTFILTTDAMTEELNMRYRGKHYPADVLSFPAGSSASSHRLAAAEIYVSVQRAQERAQESNTAFQQQVFFLFLHAVLHLLGHTHGKEMERLEDKYATRYVYP